MRRNEAENRRSEAPVSGVVERVTIASTLPLDATHPHALALYCSDGRFTDSVEELVHGLGHARLDTITLPGGPAHPNLLNTGYAELETVSRAASFLIRSHAITHVFLLAHEGCGSYRSQMTGGTQKSIADAQRIDLKVATKVLQALHHAIQIQCWFATPVKARVQFDPV